MDVPPQPQITSSAGSHVRVSWPLDYLAEYNHVEIRDDAWRARRDAEEVERKRKLAEERERLARERDDHAALVETATGLRKAILELHSPIEDSCGFERYNGCRGCDAGPYAEGSGDWPCETYTLAKDWPNT